MGHLEHFRRDSVAGGRQEVTPGTLSREFRARWEAEKDTWYTFAWIPCQVGGGKGHLVHFCVDTVPGGRQEVLPDTLLRGFRARWAAGKDTWYTFAGIPCQVGGGKGHLVHFCRDFRGRWTAGRDTWNTFAGIPWQVDGGKRHLEHFRRDSVAGGRQERTPGTLSREFRARWAAGWDTWNTFAGIPWQVDGGKRHLEHFRGKTVAGGQRGKTPDTLSRDFRARWTAGRDTWNTFAGIPWQVDGRKGHLERFRRDSVPGGRRKETPGTLSQGFRARWVHVGRDILWHSAGPSRTAGPFPSREPMPASASVCPCHLAFY